MFRIRYYDRMIHPHEFKGSFSGLVIRVLNWIRWKLEVRVQRRVMRHLLKVADPKKKKLMQRLFELDVKREQLDAETLSPEVAPLEAARTGGPRELPKAPRFKSLLDNVQEELATQQGLVRPKPIDGLASRYAVNRRARRYAKGILHVANNEDDIEPVPKGGDDAA